MNTWIIVSCVLVIVAFVSLLENLSKRKIIKAIQSLTWRGTSSFSSVLPELSVLSYKAFKIMEDQSLSRIRYNLTLRGADFKNFSKMYSELQEKKFKSKKVKQALVFQLKQSLELADKDFLCALYIDGIHLNVNNTDHKIAYDTLYEKIISKKDNWSRNILLNIKKEIENIIEKEEDPDEKILLHANLIEFVRKSAKNHFHICS